MRVSGHLLRGAAWSVLGKAAQFVLGLVALVLIARDLGPEVYGIYAMGWVVLGLFDIVISSAPVDALVQRRDATRGHFNVSFWFSLLAATTAAVAIMLNADRIDTAFGGELLLAAVMPLRALVLPIRAAAVGPLAALMRESRFGTIAATETLASTIASAVGVALALAGAGVWSLVVMELLRAVISTLAAYRVSGWRPGLAMRWQDLRELSAFNINTWLSWGMGYMDGQLPRLIVHPVLGSEAVGYLSLAQRLYDTVSDVLVVPIYSVIQSGTARAQDRPAEVRRIASGALTLGGLLATPVFIGMAMLMPWVAPAAFGAEWLPAILIVQLVVMNGVRLPMAVMQGAVIRGFGKAHWDLASAALLILCNGVLLWFAAPHGLTAVAVAMLVGGWLIWPLDGWFVRRLIDLGLAAQFGVFFRTMIAGAAMAAALHAVGTGPLATTPTLAALPLLIVIGACVYALVLFVTLPAVARQAVRVLKAVLRLDREGIRAALGSGDG